MWGHHYAGVAKLVDAPDLGSGAARRGGSSPSTRTKLKLLEAIIILLKTDTERKRIL